MFFGAMYVQTSLTMTCTIPAYISTILADRGLTHVHSDSAPFVDDLVKLPPAAPGETEWIGLVMATKRPSISTSFYRIWVSQSVTRPPLIYNDNEGTLSWVSDPTHLERRRHIRIRRSFIEDAHENKLVTFSWCSSDDNEADFFKKALTRANFVSQRSRIVGW